MTIRQILSEKVGGGGFFKIYERLDFGQIHGNTLNQIFYHYQENAKMDLKELKN